VIQLVEDFGGGGTITSCSGDVAATSFGFGICTCDALSTGGSSVIDAYDSTSGPYVAGAPNLGGGVGTNASYSCGSTCTITGDLWTGASDSGLKNLTVDEQIHINGTVSGSATLIVDGESFVSGSFTKAANLSGDLFIPSCSGVAATFLAGAVCVPSPNPQVSPAPCLRCLPQDQVPIANFVTHYSTAANNNNAVIGLSTSALNTPGTVRLDLPCGYYYLQQIGNGSGSVTLAAHGNTALFVGGDINVSSLTVAVDPAARFDIFVNGNVTLGSGHIGTPAYPSQLRIYATGNISFQSSSSINGDFYAPNGTYSTQGSAVTFGAIFAKDYSTGGSTTVHYDKASVAQAQSCPSPSPNTGCTTCLDCANQACVNGTCGSCTSDGECCAPLRCVSGTCKFTSF
jgi:hypothetical protein